MDYLPPTHGIFTPYPWNIDPSTQGILTPLPMLYRPPILDILTPYRWYIDPPTHVSKPPRLTVDTV